jgi:hypothetical protein
MTTSSEPADGLEIGRCESTPSGVAHEVLRVLAFPASEANLEFVDARADALGALWVRACKAPLAQALDAQEVLGEGRDGD